MKLIPFRHRCPLSIASILTACAVICSCGSDSGSAKLTTVRFDVQGMHCQGCVSAIDAQVREVKGVNGARVSLESHSAEVDLVDPAAAADVEKAIKGLGYKVTPVAAAH